MGSTTIYVTKSSAKAAERKGYLQGAGFSVTGIKSTDTIEITGEAAPTVIWDSGEEGDWYIVIATHDPHSSWSPPELE